MLTEGHTFFLLMNIMLRRTIATKKFFPIGLIIVSLRIMVRNVSISSINIFFRKHKMKSFKYFKKVSKTDRLLMQSKRKIL